LIPPPPDIRSAAAFGPDAGRFIEAGAARGCRIANILVHPSARQRKHPPRLERFHMRAGDACADHVATPLLVSCAHADSTQMAAGGSYPTVRAKAAVKY